MKFAHTWTSRRTSIFFVVMAEGKKEGLITQATHLGGCSKSG